MSSEDYTMGEFEEMDLRELHDQQFMVAVSSGPRDEPKFMCGTLCGPFEFYDMCSTVGKIFEEQIVHPKVLICEKEFGSAPKVLDEKTVDFIEARYQDIIMEAMLVGDLDDREYTCKAGFIEEKQEEKDGKDNSGRKD